MENELECDSVGATEFEVDSEMDQSHNSEIDYEEEFESETSQEFYNSESDSEESDSDGEWWSENDVFTAMGDETVHPNLSFKAIDAVFLILSYYIRHKLTWVVLSNLLTLLHNILGEQSILPRKCLKKYLDLTPNWFYIFTVESVLYT